jgi:hypothetical protein
MTQNKMLNAALAYALLGWRVHPLKPSTKIPFTKWKDSATTDEKQIRNWWIQTPSANIGIATGSDSVVVLDVDIKGDKRGDNSLLELFDQHGAIDTLMAKTPSGGFHLYMTPDPKHTYSNAVDFAEGLDFRADNGYIVAPPSQIGGASYEWV